MEEASHDGVGRLNSPYEAQLGNNQEFNTTPGVALVEELVRISNNVETHGGHMSLKDQKYLQWKIDEPQRTTQRSARGGAPEPEYPYEVHVAIDMLCGNLQKITKSWEEPLGAPKPPDSPEFLEDPWGPEDEEDFGYFPGSKTAQ
ncbi:hypothetical protein PtB15_14B462 [Puccinia triticina]|nr:hypothetical protein PtB15_14B462 [Puccinia triticina]